MKWFKHYSDNYRGRSIEEIYSQMGHTGISCYFILTEICTEKLEKSSTKSIDKDDCEFNFSLAFVRRNLRISSDKLKVFLNIASGLGLFQFEISEKELKIFYPILLNLLDSDSKKTRSIRDTSATETRLDKDKDKDKEVEVVDKTPTTKNKIEIFNIPDNIMQTVKINFGYPEEIITQVANEAWLIYLTQDPNNRSWPRFLSYYFKNESGKIRDRLVDMAKGYNEQAEIERLRAKYAEEEA